MSMNNHRTDIHCAPVLQLTSHVPLYTKVPVPETTIYRTALGTCLESYNVKFSVITVQILTENEIAQGLDSPNLGE